MFKFRDTKCLTIFLGITEEEKEIILDTKITKDDLRISLPEIYNNLIQNNIKDVVLTPHTYEVTEIYGDYLALGLIIQRVHR